MTVAEDFQEPVRLRGDIEDFDQTGKSVGRHNDGGGPQERFIRKVCEAPAYQSNICLRHRDSDAGQIQQPAIGNCASLLDLIDVEKEIG